MQFQCNIENTLFERLCDHVKSYHGECKNTHGECDKVSKKNVLINSYELSTIYSCLHCEYESSTNTNMNYHFKCVHGGRIYVCQDCNSNVTQDRDFNHHNNFVHGRITHTCCDCESKTHSICDRSGPPKNIHGDHSVQCALCGQMLVIDSVFLDYIYTEHTILPCFMCNLCKTKIDCTNPFKNGNESETREERRLKGQCSHCESKTNLNILFAKHIRIKCNTFLFGSLIMDEDNIHVHNMEDTNQVMPILAAYWTKKLLQ